MNLFYDLPTFLSLFIFVALIVGMSLSGLFLYNTLDLKEAMCDRNFDVVGIYITVVSAFLGIILTFIIVAVWDGYREAQIDAEKEAYALYSLYENVVFMPGTDFTQKLIQTYMEEIINVEYPIMKAGQTPPATNETLKLLQERIYSYNPTDEQSSVLYAQSLDLLTNAIELRIDRLASAAQGVNSLVSAVSILDSILIIILCWLLTCGAIFHYFLSTVIAIYVASAIFLIFILGHPFRGYAALPPQAFIVALRNMNSIEPIQVAQ